LKRKFLSAAVLVASLIGLIVFMNPSQPIQHIKAAVVATAKPVAIAAPVGVNGYTLLDANGNIYNFGTTYYGGAGRIK
jgi:hypothetical protein